MSTMRRNGPWAAIALLILMAAGALGVAGAPQAPPPAATTKIDGNLYVLTFIDVLPQFTAPTTALVQQYGADSKRDAGLVRFEAIAQINGRDNHIMLLSVWKSQQAFDAHMGQAHTKTFREKLLPMLGAPFDERFSTLIPPLGAPNK